MAEQRNLEEMEILRVKALEDQDPERYATYCDELGLSGSSIEDLYLYDRAFGRIELVEEIEQTESERTLRNQTLHERLHEDAKRRGIRVDNLFVDIEAKRSALRDIMGYETLRGFSSIGEASDQAVTNVYRRVYNSSN